MSAQVFKVFPGLAPCFITEDKALDTLLNYLVPKNIRLEESPSGEQAVCGLSIDAQLFPELDGKGVDRLLERLKVELPK